MYLASRAVLAHRYHVIGFLRLECEEVEVFIAEDDQTGRRVAVSAGCIGSKWRLAPELWQAALANSKAHGCRVLPLLDIVQDEEHGIVLVHELREGETLRSRVKRGGPMSFDALLPLIEHVWLGLCEMHAVGTVHGTINPSNVLIDGSSLGGDRLTILPPRIDGLKDWVDDERIFAEQRPGLRSCGARPNAPTHGGTFMLARSHQPKMPGQARSPDAARGR